MLVNILFNHSLMIKCLLVKYWYGKRRQDKLFSALFKRAYFSELLTTNCNDLFL